MRLKVLFAPLAFLVAVVVAIFYIWPVVIEIQTKTGELKASEESLMATREKNKNLEILGGVLEKNKDKEAFILGFLPDSRSEEKIIDEISYLATDSGVTLVSTSIAEEKTANQPGQASAIPAETVPGGASTQIKPEVKFLKVNSVISGNYESIKIFLGQVYKMEALSEIKSLDLNVSTNDSADELTANVEIKFGYLPALHEDGNKFSYVFSKNNFDFNLYNKINDSVVKKIPVLDSGQKGKINPFQ